MRVNRSRGNSRAASHSGACGRISFSTNERSDSRSASCSSVKGGIVRAHAAHPVLGVRPGAVALAHLVPLLQRRVAAAVVVEAEQVALRGSSRRSGGRRAPRRSGRRARRTTRCRGRCRCTLPWRGSRHSIVHSITTSSPCSMPCSRCQLASRCLTPCSVISPIASRAAVRAEPRVEVVRVGVEVARDLLHVAGVQVAVVGAHALERGEVVHRGSFGGSSQRSRPEVEARQIAYRSRK